ncbi:hypothetical protein DW062_06450 [Clostridium sp. AF43-10]|nr:hypothetical protein DW062_06450 [Clostridium sp. AF43-10]
MYRHGKYLLPDRLHQSVLHIYDQLRIQRDKPRWIFDLYRKIRSLPLYPIGILRMMNLYLQIMPQYPHRHCGKDWSSHHQHKHQKIKLAMQKIVDHPIYKEQ